MKGAQTLPHSHFRVRSEMQKQSQLFFQDFLYLRYSQNLVTFLSLLIHAHAGRIFKPHDKMHAVMRQRRRAASCLMAPWAPRFATAVFLVPS